MDDLLEDSATPQQISEAVKRELSQVSKCIIFQMEQGGHPLCAIDV